MCYVIRKTENSIKYYLHSQYSFVKDGFVFSWLRSIHMATFYETREDALGDLMRNNGFIIEVTITEKE